MSNLLSIHAGSLAIGIIAGFVIYITFCIIAAIFFTKNWDKQVEDNDSLYENKLHEAGYTEDIFE